MAPGLSSRVQATPAQLAAERKVAELHGKLHSAESKVRQLTEELRRLKQQLVESGGQVIASLGSKLPASCSLERELQDELVCPGVSFKHYVKW